MCSVHQTREQLQAELNACQARNTDLERSLSEKGQVKEKRDGEKRHLAPGSVLIGFAACVSGSLFFFVLVPCTCSLAQNHVMLRAWQLSPNACIPYHPSPERVAINYFLFNLIS